MKAKKLAEKSYLLEKIRLEGKKIVAYYYFKARLVEVKNIVLLTNQNTDKNMLTFVKLSVR